MKKSNILLTLIGLAASACLVYFFVQTVASGYLEEDEQAAQLCSTAGQTHKVEIKDSEAAPKQVDARLCDKLTIINLDSKDRKVSFGVHDRHISYDGITEQILRQGQSLTITLNQTGSYVYHDHFQEETGGSFRVN